MLHKYQFLPTVHQYQFFTDEQQAKNLLEMYHNEWNGTIYGKTAYH